MDVFGHELALIQEKAANGRGFATVSCRCQRWSRQTEWCVTPLVARRIARRLHKEHARKAAIGVVTVTDGLTGPEMVANPDDERSFLAETARFHRAGGRRPTGDRVQLAALPDEPDEQLTPEGWWAARGVEPELHPATIADLEAMAS